MTGLPRSIIKKYGVSKKAWSVYRASRSPTRKSTNVREQKTMARRKRSSRRSGSRVARRRRGGGSGGDGLMSMVTAGAIYGAARAPVANTVGGFVPRFAGDYTDEIVMGGLSWAAYKYGSGMVRNIGKAGLYVESANAGQSLTGSSMATSSTSASW